MPTLRYAPRPIVVASVALLSALLAGREALAGFSVPSPGRSTVSPVLNVEPGGNLPFSVTVRDQDGSLINNSTVMIDLCACPAIVLCPGPLGPQEWVTNGCEYRGSTIGGTHTFNIKGGGGCSPVNVNIYADGVLFATRRVTSPDQNGDLVVDLDDTALITAKFGTSDLSGDLNGDGVVGIPDRVILASFLYDTCIEPTPTHRSTWGEVKIRYR